MINHLDRLNSGPVELPTGAHLFAPDDVKAIRTALFTERPLLLLGEPGTGKSQLAKAAAVALGRVFRSITVSSKTEATDLIWRYDAVKRLGNAQLVGALEGDEAKAKFEELREERYIVPGPVWWGFCWETAAGHMQQHHGVTQPEEETQKAKDNGLVILIDEIDKAESDVPNGLLEAFGSGQITVPSFEGPIVASGHPLVVITSNEERPVPAPFLRRCVVHELRLPEEGLQDYLIERGRVHFPKVSKALLERAAETTVEDRERARSLFPRPGLAEFIDLVRAADTGEKAGAGKALTLLEEARGFVMHKHASLKKESRR